MCSRHKSLDLNLCPILDCSGSLRGPYWRRAEPARVAIVMCLNSGVVLGIMKADNLCLFHFFFISQGSLPSQLLFRLIAVCFRGLILRGCCVKEHLVFQKLFFLFLFFHLIRATGVRSVLSLNACNAKLMTDSGDELGAAAISRSVGD